MLIKKETSTIVKIELDETEKANFKNYSRGTTDHCTLELANGVYFVFCKSNNDLIQFNGQNLFVGELELAIKQEQDYYNDIVIKYSCDNSCKIGSVLGNKSLIQPIFYNNKIGYDYVNDTLYCYNVA